MTRSPNKVPGCHGGPRAVVSFPMPCRSHHPCGCVILAIPSFSLMESISRMGRTAADDGGEFLGELDLFGGDVLVVVRVVVALLRVDRRVLVLLVLVGLLHLFCLSVKTGRRLD